ncbi:MAG: acyl-ACP--UDP-N-acetylglucosamine O-acyltransferase [Thermoguttaceae bacterium]
MSIHTLAAVAETAAIGSRVRIGPFCVVESDVTIGDGCILENGAIIRSGTTLGAGNHVFEGAVLGGDPQHTHMPENPGRLVIGDGNTIRENVTIHRAMEPENATIVGNDNLLMVNSHVAHDCCLGDHTILTNNVMLAGHVRVEDRAFLSGAAAVHQFCRIGTLAMVGGQSHATRDVPPFVTVDGLSSLVVGLNQIGLRRAGFDQQQIRQLKDAYRVVYRSGLLWKEMLVRLRSEFADGPAAQFYEFLSTTTRGITPERRMPPGATLKLRRESESDHAPEARAKAG